MGRSSKNRTLMPKRSKAPLVVIYAMPLGEWVNLTERLTRYRKIPNLVKLILMQCEPTGNDAILACWQRACKKLTI